jgi:hypothetical protein
MSTRNQAPSPSASEFTQIFQAACDEYRRLTGHDLKTHPLATELEGCHSPDGTLTILRKQVDALIKYDRGYDKLLVYLNLIVNVLFTLSEERWADVGLVSFASLLHHIVRTSDSQPCSPGETICTGIGVLLVVRLSCDSLSAFA